MVAEAAVGPVVDRDLGLAITAVVETEIQVLANSQAALGALGIAEGLMERVVPSGLALAAVAIEAIAHGVIRKEVGLARKLFKAAGLSKAIVAVVTAVVTAVVIKVVPLDRVA